MRRCGNSLHAGAVGVTERASTSHTAGLAGLPKTCTNTGLPTCMDTELCGRHHYQLRMATYMLRRVWCVAAAPIGASMRAAAAPRPAAPVIDARYTHHIGDLLALLCHLAHAATNKALDREEGVLWVDHCLALGNLQQQQGNSTTQTTEHTCPLPWQGVQGVWDCGVQGGFGKAVARSPRVRGTATGAACEANRRTCPTRRSPVLVKATTEGVVRPPSALVMIVGLPPSMAATAELVVPRSMPTTCTNTMEVSTPRQGLSMHTAFAAGCGAAAATARRRPGATHLLCTDAHCAPGDGGSHPARIAGHHGGATNAIASDPPGLHFCCCCCWWCLRAKLLLCMRCVCVCFKSVVGARRRGERELWQEPLCPSGSF